MSNRPRQRVAEVMADYKHGYFVLFGRLVVDDDKARTSVLGHQGETGRGPDHQRRTDREEQIALPGKFRCPLHGFFRHRLAERNGSRLYRLLTGYAVRRLT